MSVRRAAAAAVESVWHGDGPGPWAARLLLTPASWAFGAAAALRGRMYDRGLLASVGAALPTIGVGNLTVGGTGKTPVAADIARRLLDAGAQPAIVLRGYGDDEPLVHARLNPRVPVVANPDRVAGVREAAAMGADVAVLDDAFQHRRLRRGWDVVLLSADRWTGGGASVRSLPAGPWREPPSALRRASLAVVTRKAASDGQVDGVLGVIHEAAPGCALAVARIEMLELSTMAAGGERSARESLATLRGERVVAVTAIGDPGAFMAQLAAHGARVEPFAWPDHHAFTPHDIRQVIAAASGSRVVCTLKDAVKLAPFWPRIGPPLWYVSQMVIYERGGAELERILEAVRAARPGFNGGHR